MQRRTVDRAASRYAVVVADGIAALASLYLARELRRRLHLPLTASRLPESNFEMTAVVAGLALGVQYLALSVFGFYGARVRLARSSGRLIAPAIGLELLLFTSLLFFFQRFEFPRSVLFVYLALNAVFLWLERTSLRRLSIPAERSRALIVGDPRQGELLAEAIRRHAWVGVDIAGIASPAGGAGSTYSVTTPEDLERVLEETKSDHVLFAPDDVSFRDRAIEHLALSGRTSLWVLPSPYETLIGRLRFRPLGELPLLEVGVSAPQGLAGAVKRGADVLASVAGLLVSSPVLVVASAAVRLLSGPPVFYSQRRVGRGGGVFRLWKLRTMVIGAEEASGAVLASRDDPRVTRIGRFLRATRIDEIPQLWNVLKGEMSVVGPRPERPEFVSQFEAKIPGYGLRHSVRPGLTGLAQISGEYETHPRIKLRYDLAYINNWSLGLDLLVALRTLPVVLTRRGI